MRLAPDSTFPGEMGICPSRGSTLPPVIGLPPLQQCQPRLVRSASLSVPPGDNGDALSRTPSHTRRSTCPRPYVRSRCSPRVGAAAPRAISPAEARTDWRVGKRLMGHYLSAPRAWLSTDLVGDTSPAKSCFPTGIMKAIMSGGRLRIKLFTLCAILYRVEGELLGELCLSRSCCRYILSYAVRFADEALFRSISVHSNFKAVNSRDNHNACKFPSRSIFRAAAATNTQITGLMAVKH